MHSIYRHLGLKEREVIEMMRGERWSMREMAQVLGRSPSTISRELRRNRSPVHAGYLDHHAQERADRRRSNASRRMRLKNDKIRDYVESKLNQDWSPEQIAGRIGIEHRPLEVEARDRFGDREADTLVSRQSKAALLSMVERKSRLVQLEKLEAKTAPVTSKAIVKRLLRFPKDARRTLTLDNGTENAGHEEISKETDIRCFFCEPYSSWQRGTNEHTNGLVRHYLPKKTDFAMISNKDIRLIEFRLNSRPRKCLDYKTPLEVANIDVALRC
ncbi:hypothetical protein CEE36_10990 [candidate division TA06 bacterium B3_TA06]|uniref:Integrase catalytic domain-containing protein n=1 Tax=candidate division TA06 bacterium B3_TA06 TaxID=2012487 RepID=A0A532URX9_UNCT6|nr:MAG: hypothetical protein CEE36_10990 [candidate division TA06 bacterium B3_TA06]